MKAIQEGLRLLLELARRRGVPATPSSLAEAVGINPSTARKLLEDLVQTGFAEQSSKRGGYTLGPSAGYLLCGGRYRNEEQKKWFAPLREYALGHHLPVQISMLQNSGRTVLLAFDGNGTETTGGFPPFLDDLYTSAAGRLLLALAPETRRIHLIWEHGIPAAAQWPEVAGDKQKFTAEITDIRRNRSVRFAGETAFAFSDEFVLSAPAAGEHELRPLAATLAGEKLP